MNLKKLFFALVACFVIMSPLMAAQKMNVTWQWESNDLKITQYRYQLDGETEGGWIVVDASVTSFEATGLDPYSDYTLYLQSTYDGENWSDTASSTALAMLTVPEVVIEEPVAEEAIVIEEEPVAEEAVIEEPAVEVVVTAVEELPAPEPIEPVAEEVVAEVEVVKKDKGDFKFNLLLAGGVDTDVDFTSFDSLLNGAYPRFSLGLDFQNIVKLGSFGLGLRSDISAIVMPVDKDWSKLPSSFDEFFNGNCNIFVDSSVDMKLMSYISGQKVDFYLGGGVGYSLFNPRLEGDATMVEYGHSLQNFSIFSSAWFVSGNTGLRYRFNDVFSLGAEVNYRYLLPAKKHTSSADLVFGFTF